MLRSYTEIADFGRAKFLKDTEAYKKIWPELQFRYHRTEPRKEINWVAGTFT